MAFVIVKWNADTELGSDLTGYDLDQGGVCRAAWRDNWGNNPNTNATPMQFATEAEAKQVAEKVLHSANEQIIVRKA